MTVINLPKVSLNIVAGQQTISNEDQKVLFVGQKLAAGSATAGALTENIGVQGEEDALFGAKSILAQMVRAGRSFNKETRFDAIALADAAGTSAAGVVTVTGTATETASLTLIVGSKENYSLTIDITSGDTATAVGDTIAAAINALTDAPFTAVNVTGTVTITATNKGTVGNKYGLKYEGSVAGVSLALTAFTSGATDPSLTGLFDVIDGVRYQTIVFQSNFSLSTLTTELDARFNVNNDVLDGVGIVTITDTYANIVSAGNAQNSKSLVMIGNALLSDADFKGGALLEFDDVIAAKVGAMRALRLTDGANISQYVISANGVKDSFGGVHISSKPYHNTLIPNIALIPAGKGFIASEQTGLNNAGVSTLGNNTARNSTILGTIVTTRKTDSGGNPEETFEKLNIVDEASAAREFFFNNLKSRFAQSRLTDGDVLAGYDMANEPVIRAFMIGLYNTISGDGYVLTQAGDTALTFFKEKLAITLDLLNGKVTMSYKLPVVSQLREIQGTEEIVFNTNS